MSSFLIQLLIISVVGLMVQSAPVSRHLQKREPTAENSIEFKLENHIYCASSAIHNVHWELPVATCTVPESQNANIDFQTLVDIVFNQLSLYCRNFTIAMSLKHQLQDFLFNTDTTPEFSSDNIQKLSEVLAHLQTMATAFDDIQYNRDHSRCVRLTAAQYGIICSVQHPNTTASLKEYANDWYLNYELYNHQNARHYTCKS